MNDMSSSRQRLGKNPWHKNAVLFGGLLSFPLRRLLAHRQQ
jgi:hypothetical protein